MLTQRTPKTVIAMLALSAAAGCSTGVTLDHSAAAAERVRNQDIGSFPYHPLLYHLDLSVLTYQLYSQSLVWPFDPYYEELDNLSWDRSGFMDRVQSWAENTGHQQVIARSELSSYRGPGRLGGFEDNPRHDPILFQYSRIDPWNGSVSNAAGRWIENRTPAAITDEISEVRICYRATGEAAGTVAVSTLERRSGDTKADAKNALLVFEGGTGGKSQEDQPPSQSLMGLVLLRAKASGEYDVHIAFRGSRSGSAARAVREALSDDFASGNPDWITDLAYNNVYAPRVSPTGVVSRGMSDSLQSTMPQILRCLEEVSSLRDGKPPENIFVTGHSLGGALAQHFVSAILMSTPFAPAGKGVRMPDGPNTWPWRTLKLITYGAPRVGDQQWASRLTLEHLESDFFSSAINPFDADAIGVTDPAILPRLLSQTRPAGYRILVPNDSITSEKVAGGKHVGKTVYVQIPSIRDSIIPDPSAHEITTIRSSMAGVLRDTRIPRWAWHYQPMNALNPSRDDDEKGSATEYRKLHDALLGYYETENLWFDGETFSESFEHFLELLQDL